MNKLEGGISITIMLVVNMLLSLLLIFGILPLFLFIMSLIALIKVGTYQRWRRGSERTTPHQSSNLKKVTCDVYILDPVKGEVVEERTIDGTVYSKSVAKSGKLYAIRSYDEGKPKTAIITEDVYKVTRKAFGIK
jgi:hypothetical protein